jgi:hypothetical protein
MSKFMGRIGACFGLSNKPREPGAPSEQAKISREETMTRFAVMSAAGLGASALGNTFANNAMGGFVGSAQTEAQAAAAVMI